MRPLCKDKQGQVLSTLVEGASIRSAERLTRVHRDTITKLVLRVGRACERLMEQEIRHVQARQLQLDEVWCFVGKKRNHLTTDDDESRLGDFWTWVALDPETKLVPHHHVGKRNEDEAVVFVRELRRRIEGRVQLSSDKLAAYRWAINLAWGGDVDYGRIVKRYAVEPASFGRYSPPACVGVDKDVIFGSPDVAKISTSHVERSNLTIRMGLRRFTRLTNGFSKKVENLRAAVALHFAHYNFCRRHLTLKTTPALAAGVANRVWTMADLVNLPWS
jgi:IS1 family transposase